MRFKSTCKGIEPYMLQMQEKIKSAEKKIMTERFKSTQRLSLHAADKKCEQQLMAVSHILKQVETICK